MEILNIWLQKGSYLKNIYLCKNRLSDVVRQLNTLSQQKHFWWTVELPIAAVLQLAAEVIYWTDSIRVFSVSRLHTKTFKYRAQVSKHWNSPLSN